MFHEAVAQTNLGGFSTRNPGFTPRRIVDWVPDFDFVPNTPRREDTRPTTFTVGSFCRFGSVARGIAFPTCVVGLNFRAIQEAIMILVSFGESFLRQAAGPAVFNRFLPGHDAVVVRIAFRETCRVFLIGRGPFGFCDLTVMIGIAGIKDFAREKIGCFVPGKFSVVICVSEFETA